MVNAGRDIPAGLEHAVMLEAGYRCAVLACRTALAVEVHHIVDYAKAREHEFDNLIVLCANCHRGLVGTGPRKLDLKALRMIKRNLALMNGRYNDTERRVLEHFVDDPDASHVVLPETPVLFSYLLKDGLLEGISDCDDSMVSGRCCRSTRMTRRSSSLAPTD